MPPAQASPAHSDGLSLGAGTSEGALPAKYDLCVMQVTFVRRHRDHLPFDKGSSRKANQMFTTKSPFASAEFGAHEETVEEFLARGGRIERIEGCPDPEGRVLRRGWRDRPAIG